MSIFDWRDIVAILALCWAIANSLWTRHVAGQNVAKSAIDDLEKRVARGERDLHALKTTVDQLPDRDMVHGIELSVTEMKGAMDTLNERIRPLSGSLQRIETYLMKQEGQS